MKGRKVRVAADFKLPPRLPFHRRVLFLIRPGPEGPKVREHILKMQPLVIHEGLHLEARQPPKRWEFSPDWVIGAGAVFELDHNDYPCVGAVRRLVRQVVVFGALVAQPQFRLLYEPQTRQWARGAPSPRFLCYRGDVFLDPPECRAQCQLRRTKEITTGIISVVRYPFFAKELEDGAAYVKTLKKPVVMDADWFRMVGPRRFANEGLPFPYLPIEPNCRRRARREDEAPPGELFV